MPMETIKLTQVQIGLMQKMETLVMHSIMMTE